MYRVICAFFDLTDNDFAYKSGDVFPRCGLIVSDERIKELSGRGNRLHRPLIEAVEEKPKSSRRKTKKEEG